jgi:2-keto-4-pentenoate hydratase
MFKHPLASKLTTARAQSTVVDISQDELPRKLPDAYAVGLEQCPEVAAWKLGGVNEWSQKVFDNARPFFGPLSPVEVHVGSESVPIGHLVSPLAEPEVAVQLGTPDNDSGRLSLAALGLAVEIPASVLPDGPKALLCGQISDRAGAGALWIRPVEQADTGLINDEIEVSFRLNHQNADQCSSTQVLGGIITVLNSFFDQAEAYGITLKPGQWIATGGLVPAKPVVPGDEITLEGLDTKTRFKLTA